MEQFLIHNDSVVAQCMFATDLKIVRASQVCAEDAINAEFTTVLVNAVSCKISSEKKWQRVYTEKFAKQLIGGRIGEFLIY